MSERECMKRCCLNGQYGGENQLRCNGIKVTFEVPLTEIDGNGITYDLQTYKSKLIDMVGLPITNGTGGECYGVITNVNVYDYTYLIEGMLFAGGTAELMKDEPQSAEVITERIVSFGLSEDWSNKSGIVLNKSSVTGFKHRVFEKDEWQ